jgi:hypothetical protein
MAIAVSVVQLFLPGFTLKTSSRLTSSIYLSNHLRVVFYGRNMAKKIQGQKGGSSSSRTPTEQPDDLQSVAKAKILLALGEGEFSSGLTGQSIFWMVHRC